MKMMEAAKNDEMEVTQPMPKGKESWFINEPLPSGYLWLEPSSIPSFYAFLLVVVKSSDVVKFWHYCRFDITLAKTLHYIFKVLY